MAIIPTIDMVQAAPLGITFLNAVENQVLKGTYEVDVKASDTSQVSNIKLYIDGVFFKTENSSPYEFNIDTTDYADGNRVLKAVATDKSGNTNAAQVIVSVVFDNVADPSPGPSPPPTGLSISFANVVQNQVLTGTYEVEVKASSTSLVSNIKLYIDGAFIKTENYSPYEFNIVTTSYPDGNRVLKAVATDKSGNTNAAEATMSVTINNVADTSPPSPVSGDSTAPVVTASPGGGSYNTAKSVSLTSNEPATIYYTLNGVAPTLSSPKYAAPLSISNDVTLKFYGIDSAGNAGNVVTESYDINISSIPSPDGIAQIYPTKSDGDEWYMNMASPTTDKRFSPKTTLTKNSDGSWKVKSTSVRSNVFTITGYYQGDIATYNQQELAAKGYMQSPNDWKNVEMTGYVKVNAYSKDDNFAWYTRGGMHGDEDCEGTAYKGDLYYSGKERFAKEQWHSGGYSFSQTKTVTEPIKSKWVGYKFIVYNIMTTQGGSDVLAAKMESWIDKNNDGNWLKVDEKLDAGGWGNEGDHCGGDADQIITWGGPVATFRWDSATDVDLKYLSVREIAPPT